MTTTRSQIISLIGELTFNELHLLAKECEDTYGFPLTISNFEIKQPKKKEYDLLLVSCDNCKLATVKSLKDLLNISLKEAKDLVDNAPAIIMTTVLDEGIGLKFTKSIEELNKAREILSKFGAEIKIRQKI